MKWTGILAVAATCAVASADVYSWDWQPGEGGSVWNGGGDFRSIASTFNDRTQLLTWEVSFLNQVTDGFTLAMNYGPDPKGHAGELALLYFDATDISNVRVSTYAYNGLNTQTSYRDGSPLSGTQAADVIFGIYPEENVPHSVLHASVIDADGGRTMRLELDTTAINAHVPNYPGSEGIAEWSGIGFDESLGIWLHPVTSLFTEYNEDGALSFWSGRQGWLDGSGFETVVPAPGVAVAGMLGFGLAGRRRRN